MAVAEQVALVTGGAKGIGLAIAKRLAKQGMTVVINAHSEPSTEEWAEIQAGNPKLSYLVGSVADEAEAAAMIAAVMTKFGRLDVLVNNAGITRDKLLSRMSAADFNTVIQTNLVGAFNMTKHAMKVMQKQRSGNIVNLASISGLNGNIGQANYAASKAGLIGLTKTAAKEGALRGIRCNAVAPGMIATAMTDKLSDRIKTEITKQIPLHRFGEADEVAQTVAFLISNPYITGQVITVDGGLTI